MKNKASQTRRMVLTVLTCVLTHAAWADQCELISPEQAGKALDFLKPTGTMVEFCEPCGDKDFYSKPQQVISAIQAVLEQEYWAVKVNGKGVDVKKWKYVESQNWPLKDLEF